MRVSQFPIRTSIAISEQMKATIVAMSEEQRISIGEVIRTLISEALAAKGRMTQEVDDGTEK